MVSGHTVVRPSAPYLYTELEAPFVYKVLYGHWHRALRAAFPARFGARRLFVLRVTTTRVSPDGRTILVAPAGATPPSAPLRLVLQTLQPYEDLKAQGSPAWWRWVTSRPWAIQVKTTYRALGWGPR